MSEDQALVVAQFQQRPLEELLLPDAIELLPLSPQPLTDWNEHNDLGRFLRALYVGEVSFLSSDGTRHSSPSSSYPKTLFTNGRKRANRWARDFQREASRAIQVPAAAKVDPIPLFKGDSAFGRAAKSLVAWESMVQSVLEESAFFSIGHVLETETDLECSFRLAACLYYKHALQVLRAFLEDAVLPIWFCEEPDDYVRWAQGSYRVPPMRGDKGLVEELVVRSVIPKALAVTFTRIYGELNAAIHAAESQLIHRGSDVGRYEGLVFKRQAFDTWSEALAEVVAVGGSLLAINIRQWGVRRSAYPLICDLCHNWKRFALRPTEFAGEAQFVATCAVCGDESTHSGHMPTGLPL